MEISTLQAFVAVARSTSFSGAADQLHLTQPAISKRIAALELELNARLFDRIGRTVLLTEAGQVLLPNAERILDEIDETRKIIATLTDQVRGRLSLATSHHIGLHRLPSMLHTYTRKYPEVELDLHFMDSEAACIKVGHGALELAIVTLPTDSPANLLLEKIWNDPLDIVVGVEHPLADHRVIALSELASHAAILPTRDTYTRAIIAKPFHETGLVPKVILETNYLETIKMMVSIGLGWSALPRTMLTQDLRIVTIDNLRWVRSLGVVRHRSRSLSNPARAFFEMLSN